MYASRLEAHHDGQTDETNIAAVTNQSISDASAMQRYGAEDAHSSHSGMG